MNDLPRKGSVKSGETSVLVLDLSNSARFSKGHIERDSCDDRLPGFVLRQPVPFERAPKVDDLFLGYRFEKILIAVQVRFYCLGIAHRSLPVFGIDFP